MVKYRDRLAIIADILKVAVEGAKKTRIMYVANLSHRLLEKYLRETVTIGFLQSNGEGYEVTEKGRNFLERYTNFSSKYSKLATELESMRFEREVLARMCELAREAYPKLIAGKRKER